MSSSFTSSPPTEAPARVARAAVVAHGKPARIGDAVSRLERCAEAVGVELVPVESGSADLVVVLGGDGTMLRALRAALGTSTPVFGVNFGRVGFLTSAGTEELETALSRVFAGDYRVVELSSLRVSLDSGSYSAINDAVVASSLPGRIVEPGWEIGGEDLGRQACDGIICATPSGSTAYNLSNGGPVLMWGIDAMVMTFVAPHSLHARPLVVPRGLVLRVTNLTPDLPVNVILDGHTVDELAPSERVEVAMGEEKSRLAVLPEVTFFTRYHDVFS